jgi:hypothetical protein
MLTKMISFPALRRSAPSVRRERRSAACFRESPGPSSRLRLTWILQQGPATGLRHLAWVEQPSPPKKGAHWDGRLQSAIRTVGRTSGSARQLDAPRREGPHGKRRARTFGSATGKVITVHFLPTLRKQLLFRRDRIRSVMQGRGTLRRGYAGCQLRAMVRIGREGGNRTVS